MRPQWLMHHKADRWRLPRPLRGLLDMVLAVLCIGAIAAAGVALLIATGALP